MYFTKEFLNKTFRFGILFTLILALLDLLTFFFYPDTKISGIFLATREQTPLTWVSVVVLLFLGLSCASVYMRTKERIWYFLALVFLFFSLDDATYLHERLSGALQEVLPFMSNFPSYSWVLLYFPLLGFGLGGLLFLLYRDANRKDKKMLNIAVFLLIMAIFLDMIDGFVGKSVTTVFCIDPTCDLSVTHLIRLCEEVFEVIGLGIFSYLNIREHVLTSAVEE